MVTIESEAFLRCDGSGDSWALAVPDDLLSYDDILILFNWPSDPTRTLPTRGRLHKARYNVTLEFQRELSEEPVLDVGPDTTRLVSRAEYPVHDEIGSIELIDLPDDFTYACMLHEDSRLSDEYPAWVTDEDITYGVVLTMTFDEAATRDVLGESYSPTDIDATVTSFEGVVETSTEDQAEIRWRAGDDEISLSCPKSSLPQGAETNGTPLRVALHAAAEYDTAIDSLQQESSHVTEFEAEVTDRQNGILHLELSSHPDGKKSGLLSVPVDQFPDTLEQPGDVGYTAIYTEKVS